jgi:hypothetical protein
MISKGMNKSLIIARSINDISKFKEHYKKDYDILALSQDVMYTLDNLKFNYKVIEDFYDEKSFIKDREVFNSNVSNFFNKLDKACEVDTDFPYSYSGNEGYFLTWLDDFFYLDHLVAIIKSSYQKIFLFSVNQPRKISKELLTLAELNSNKTNGTISLPRERSIERKLGIICNSITVDFIKDSKLHDPKISIFNEAKFFVNRVEGFLRRRLKTQVTAKKKTNLAKNINIYIAQDGYEVLYLKKYLPKYKYLNPFTKLRGEMLTSQKDTIEASVINSLLKEFILDNFNYIGRYIDLIFRSYHEEIVSRIRPFKISFDYDIKASKPSLMLFSTGIRDVFDMVIGYVGNKNNIPLVFFQHGGHSEYTYKSTFNPYKKCVENNTKISKTLIIHSQYEFQCLKNYEPSVLALGSISRFEMLHSNTKVKQSEKILFCLGPDVNCNFRHLEGFYSSAKKYKSSCHILSLINSQLLSADIKLHPSGEVGSYFFYKQLIKTNNYKKINTIYGGFGELIANKYKLVIVDYIASALFNYILALNVCVIIYIPDFENLVISHAVKDDLRDRCYIAKNKIDLEYLLIRYKKSELPTKWSNLIIEKYTYPSDDSNPGEEIANYINSMVKVAN